MAQVAKDERKNQTRVDDTREADPVHGVDFDKPWQPPHNLTAPEPRPGMAQRWIRIALQGEDDHTNLAKAMQEGWTPRKADTVPGSFPVPSLSHGRFAGCIGVHGLVLCEMPAKRLAQRADYYAAQADKQQEAVKHDLFIEQRPGMPIEQQRESKVSKGSRPKIADE